MSNGKEHAYLIRAMVNDLEHKTCQAQIFTYYDSFHCEWCSEHDYCVRYMKVEDKRLFR